jgi:hypothetical protein
MLSSRMLATNDASSEDMYSLFFCSSALSIDDDPLKFDFFESLNLEFLDDDDDDDDTRERYKKERRDGWRNTATTTATVLRRWRL